jgi:nucleotide-binding universal stress UspA family protein
LRDVKPPRGIPSRSVLIQRKHRHRRRAQHPSVARTGRKEKRMKIVLAVDGSPYTKRMLSYLAAHEELVAGNNECLALNVTAEVPPHAARHLPREVLHQYYADEGEKVLKPVRGFAQMQGWTLRERHVVGYPADVVAEIVEAEAPDLLVMGSHGHGALTAAVLGSVSARVLARTSVPVLLIR